MTKKQKKRKLIQMQNTYGKEKGKIAWLNWVSNKESEKNA